MKERSFLGVPAPTSQTRGATDAQFFPLLHRPLRGTGPGPSTSQPGSLGGSPWPLPGRRAAHPLWTAAGIAHPPSSPALPDLQSSGRPGPLASRCVNTDLDVGHSQWVQSVGSDRPGSGASPFWVSSQDASASCLWLHYCGLCLSSSFGWLSLVFICMLLGV